jgi:drug/metabolite transporter (DMT)-like permease
MQSNVTDKATPDESVRSRCLMWLAFVSVVILGGSNPVAIRFSHLELPPFWSAAIRFTAAAVVFWAIVLVRRLQVPKGRALTGALVFGALNVGVSGALMYWGLVHVPASLTMTILSLGPLLTFFLAWAHRQEAFRWRGLLGAVVAVAGMLIGVGNAVGPSIPLLPILALIAAAVAIAEAAVLFKLFPRSDPIVANALALTIGAIILVVISLIVGEAWSLPATRTAWTAYAYLVLGGSVALFYLYLNVLQRWTASATSYSYLLYPVATIVITAWLANEVISPRFLVGSAIVLVGVWAGAIA